MQTHGDFRKRLKAGEDGKAGVRAALKWEESADNDVKKPSGSG